MTHLLPRTLPLAALTLALGCASAPKVSPSAANFLSIENDQIVLKDKVYFESGTATLDPRSNALLDAVAEVLKENEKLKVVVEGHTDNQGDPAANMKLSQSRAETVVAYLRRKGVEVERLQAKGLGDTQPVAPNDDENGRSKNRRVEFDIAK